MTSASWGLGVEMFGEIEDLANAGSFNDQVQSIGPTLFINFGDNDGEAKGHDDDEHKAKADDDDEKGGPGTNGVLDECRRSVRADGCHVRRRN
jgi:hypothetical protein